jgi:hypothetical protein
MASAEAGGSIQSLATTTIYTPLHIPITGLTLRLPA